MSLPRTRVGNGLQALAPCVWVTNWSSTSCDLGIFVDQPAEPIATSEVKAGL